METILGPLGFTIPVQHLSASQEVQMTPAEVTAWRNHLPLADTGTSARKVFRAISDCNMVNMSSMNRFEILELIRTPVQFICQSLRKPYFNQSIPLSKHSWMIANLAETLQQSMALGYKLIIEQLDQSSNEEWRA